MALLSNLFFNIFLFVVIILSFMSVSISSLFGNIIPRYLHFEISSNVGLPSLISVFSNSLELFLLFFLLILAFFRCLSITNYVNYLLAFFVPKCTFVLFYDDIAQRKTE